jgi:hypothetical protein
MAIIKTNPKTVKKTFPPQEIESDTKLPRKADFGYEFGARELHRDLTEKHFQRVPVAHDEVH